MSHLPSSLPHPGAGLALPGRDWSSLRFLARNRFQLLGATLFAVLLPTLAAAGRPSLGTGWWVGGAQATAIAAFACVITGAFIRRQLGAFPGGNGFSNVLLSFGSAYGTIILLSLLPGGMDLIVGPLLYSFAAALLWFCFLTIVEVRGCRPSFVVVPRGDAMELLHIDKADWHIALSPDDIPSRVHGVVADLYAGHAAKWRAYLTRCALLGVPVYHSRHLRERLTGRVEIRHLPENDLGSVLPSSIYLRFKRLADLVVVVAVGPFGGIVALAVSLLIKVDDGGPILFRQQRRGFHGDTFTMLKFRTMRADASGHSKAFTDENDPRITRIGRFLRRYRLDELPQLVNILKGEMSLVGPRPEALCLAEWYEKNIPFYAYRHMVRPGITGWAQINQGNVAEIDNATVKLEYDFYYIRNISIWLEALILIRTVRTVLSGFGAR